MPFKSMPPCLGFGVAHGFSSASRQVLLGSTEFLSLPVHRDTSIQLARSSRPQTIQCKRGSNYRNRQRGDGRRPSRVGELIRRELSPIIENAFARSFRVEDSESAVLVSVVDVKCSDDLRNARVSVSVFGTDEQKDSTLRWLRSARKELRFELAQCVRLKYIPDLSFEESEMAAAVMTMNILNKLAREREEKSSVEQEKAEGESASTGNHVSPLTKEKDSMVADDLGEFDGYIDEDDDAEDVVIIDVAADDEDEGGMVFNPDEALKR